MTCSTAACGKMGELETFPNGQWIDQCMWVSTRGCFLKMGMVILHAVFWRLQHSLHAFFWICWMCFFKDDYDGQMAKTFWEQQWLSPPGAESRIPPSNMLIKISSVIRVCDYVGWHLVCKNFLQYYVFLRQWYVCLWDVCWMVTMPWHNTYETTL